jgi:hypothetical protein
MDWNPKAEAKMTLSLNWIDLEKLCLIVCLWIHRVRIFVPFMLSFRLFVSERTIYLQKLITKIELWDNLNCFTSVYVGDGQAINHLIALFCNKLVKQINLLVSRDQL